MSRISKTILLFLTIVGTFFRFYRLSLSIGWWGDAARDYLVAYHLAKFNDSLIVGHFATGLSGGFYHPPYYYYLLSLFVRIYESPYFVTGAFTLLHALSVVTMYEIGKDLFDEHTGLLSAFLFAVSAAMVNTSVGLISASATLPIILLSMLFFIKAVKTFKKKLVYISLALLLIAGSMWYGSLTPMPFMFAIICFRFWKSKRFLFTLLVVVVMCLFLIELPLILFFGIDRVIAVFSPLNNISVGSGVFWKSINIMGAYFVNIFNQNVRFARCAALVVVVLAVYLWSSSPRSLRKIMLAVLAITPIILLGSIKQGNFLPHYGTPYEPVVFIVVGYLFTQTFYVAQSRTGKIFIGALFVFFVFFVSDGFLYLRSPSSNYNDSRNLAKILLQQAKGFSFRVSMSADDTPPGWESPMIWYFLEKDLHTKLIRLTNYGENLQETGGDYVYRVIVCRDTDSPSLRDTCLNKFTGVYNMGHIVNRVEYDEGQKYTLYFMSKGAADQ